MKVNSIYTTFQGIEYFHTQYEDYFISKCGKVISCKWGKTRLLKQSFDTKKYLTVTINRTTKKVHRIMAETFFENWEKLQVNHIRRK